MSLKKELLDRNDCTYILDFDFFHNLDVVEGAMLDYLIDLDDFKKADGKWMEITPSYVQLKRRGWNANTIRSALKKLEAKGLIDAERKNRRGRGNLYRLNINNINELVDNYKKPDQEICEIC